MNDSGERLVGTVTEVIDQHYAELQAKSRMNFTSLNEPLKEEDILAYATIEIEPRLQVLLNAPEKDVIAYLGIFQEAINHDLEAELKARNIGSTPNELIRKNITGLPGTYAVSEVRSDDILKEEWLLGKGLSKERFKRFIKTLEDHDKGRTEYTLLPMPEKICPDVPYIKGILSLAYEHVGDSNIYALSLRDRHPYARVIDGSIKVQKNSMLCFPNSLFELRSKPKND